MATGNTGKKRGRPPGGATRAKQVNDSNLASSQFLAVILFAIGIFTFFLTIIEGQSFWKFLHNTVFGIFGLCGYLLAPIIIYIAIIIAFNKYSGKEKHKLWQGFMFIAIICGILLIFSKIDITDASFFKTIAIYFNKGIAIKGGGILGMLLGYSLLSLFGKIGAAITLFLLLFVFFMLITGFTLLDFFGLFTSPAKNLKESFDEQLEQRELAKSTEPIKDKNLKDKFNIDVDLGPEKREKEMHEQEKIIDESTTHFKEIVDKINGKEPKETKSIIKPAKIEEVEYTEVVDIDQDGTQGYVFPPFTLLDRNVEVTTEVTSDELKRTAQKLVDTLKSFGVATKILDICRGPTVTRYELQPLAGVKISKITSLADDIALNLASAGVRIEAPIPNKAAVGIEVPNKNISMVNIREILDTPTFQGGKSKLTVALGKDIAGNVTTTDIFKMPHMLIAGATGSGKSVCINTIIISLIFKSSPDEVRFLMIDPKVVELGVYNGIPHLLVPVVTDARKAAGALGWAVTEMLNRYKLFAEHNVKDLAGFNLLASSSETLKPLPQVVIIIDELADLMMVAPNEVEDSICRLAQMARASGMHLIIATQRPSVDVITGVIKANIPSRIAFAVSSQIDSRTILDSAGAEKLVGRGDMLFYPVGMSKPIRIQGCFVSEKEVERVVTFIKNNETADYSKKILEDIEKHAVAEKSSKSNDTNDNEDDEMMNAAIEVIIDAGLASTSLLQRRLKLGYARAARIIDQMELKGIVGPFQGSKPRTVMITRQQWIEMYMKDDLTV